MTFDEVFTALVERQRESDGVETTEGDADAATEGEASTSVGGACCS